MTTVRSDRARTKVAAMGIPATSAIVAIQAIQDASSEETENPPPTSAMARSTSCEEMLEPTMATVTTPMVAIATERGGGPAALGEGEVLPFVMERTCRDYACAARRADTQRRRLSRLKVPAP